MDAAGWALILSIAAIAVSLVSVAWQIVSWRHSGVRARVAIVGVASEMSWPADKARSFGPLPHEVSTFGVTVSNVGRLPFDVASIIVEVGPFLTHLDGRMQDVAGPLLPARVDVGAQCTWFWDAESFGSAVSNCQHAKAETDQKATVKASARLGTGALVEGDQRADGKRLADDLLRPEPL